MKIQICHCKAQFLRQRDLLIHMHHAAQKYGQTFDVFDSLCVFPAFDQKADRIQNIIEKMRLDLSAERVILGFLLKIARFVDLFAKQGVCLLYTS